MRTAGAKGAEKRNDETARSRPCVVVQNDVGNRYSATTIVVPLTDTDQFKNLPVQVWADAAEINMTIKKDSIIECGHIYTIDGDERVLRVRGTLSTSAMTRVDAALKVSLDLQ